MKNAGQEPKTETIANDDILQTEGSESASYAEVLPENRKLPVATHKGELLIGDPPIQCFVLDDERRVLSGRSVTSAMGLTGRGPGWSWGQKLGSAPYGFR